MSASPKNHTISVIAAKTILRLMLVFLVMVLAFYLVKDQQKLQRASLYFENKWMLVFPALLFVSFIALLIKILSSKYRHVDINWLFVLNGGLLLVYLGLLFSRIYALV